MYKLSKTRKSIVDPGCPYIASQVSTNDFNPRRRRPATRTPRARGLLGEITS
jgi:hypothetical protein